MSVERCELLCPLPCLALDRVQQRARRIEVQRVAELVGLRRPGRLDAGRLLARVVAAVAALAERPEQIAQRAVAEEIERLVGDLEGDLSLSLAARARGRLPLPPFALGIQIGRRRDVALLGHALDDLLNQLLELRPRVGLIAVGRIAQQPLDRLLGQHAAVEQRIQNRIVQRLHRALLVVHAVRVAEPAGEEQIGELRHQIFEIEVVEVAAREFRVPGTSRIPNS